MPFIAIAIALSLFVGGSAAAAATPAGHAAIGNATKIFAQVQADFTGESDDANTSDTDTSIDAQASLNADDSVTVNIF